MIHRKSREEIKRMRHAGHIVALVHKKMREVVEPGISTKELDSIAMKVIKENNIPVFGTCAGMVLLGKKTDFNQPLLELMDITVKRNTYGRQKDSFEAEIEILNQKYSGVFIRAPALESYDGSKNDIKILSEFDGEIIAIQQGHNIAISFHPELTEDTLIHEYFIEEVLTSLNH